MARSDLVKRLFLSYSRGDDRGFRAAASEVIEDERRKRHALLARELESILTPDPRGPGVGHPLTLRPLPKARDDRPLLRLGKPDHALPELVLHAEIMRSVTEVIRETRSASLLTAYALRPRQRLLFVGPPGTGKTATAHALAAELSLPIATANLASIISSYLGDTARNLEAIFGFAETQPCVLLLDEFDTVAKERGDRGDHGELKRIVATVLQLLEDFRGESLIIATSNHAQLLDEAIWRRFDDVIRFTLPNVSQIEQILKLKFRTVPHALPVSTLAHGLAGCSQADLDLLYQNAVREMVLDGDHRLTAAHLDSAARHLQRRGEVREQSASRPQTNGEEDAVLPSAATTRARRPPSSPK